MIILSEEQILMLYSQLIAETGGIGDVALLEWAILSKTLQIKMFTHLFSRKSRALVLCL